MIKLAKAEDVEKLRNEVKALAENSGAASTCFATCTDSRDTLAKTVTVDADGFALADGVTVTVRFNNGLRSTTFDEGATTLNINGTGAKELWINGVDSTAVENSTEYLYVESNGVIAVTYNAASDTYAIVGREAVSGGAGADGKSAYEYAKDGGYTGTEEEFAVMLAKGFSPEIEYYTLTEDTGGETDSSTPVDIEVSWVENTQMSFNGMSKALSSYSVSGTKYAVIDVNEGEKYHGIKLMSYYQARAYIFTDDNDVPIEVYPTTADTTKKYDYEVDMNVPSGATKLYVHSTMSTANCATIQKYPTETTEDTETETPAVVKKYVLDTDKMKEALGVGNETSAVKAVGDVVAVKAGEDIQVRTPLRGIDGVMAVNISTNGSNNGAMNFSNYVYGNKPSNENTIITGTSYKSATDDICPIKYNGSYTAGNHGNICGCKVVATGHGKTDADIGSLWTSASKTFILLSIIDENNLLVCSDYSGNPSSPLDIMTTPSESMVHSSGATNTSDISVESAGRYQICPSINNRELTIVSDSGNVLTEDGYITGEYVDIIETYNIIDIPIMLATIKENVGSNTSSSYYAETLSSEMYYETIYRYFKSGCCLVISNVVPLREGIGLTIFGGTQSQSMGSYAYIPFTSYGSITEIDSSGIILTSDTWNDAEFPPYKFYEFNADNDKAFVVGYCLYGQTNADERVGTSRACWYDGSTKKVYPCIYYGSSKEIYGTGITSYSWRTPIIKDENGILCTWYKVENDTFVEIEFMNAYSGQVSISDELKGKRFEVVKKTDTVNVLGDIVGTNGVNFIVSDVGSVTLRCY